MLSFPLFELYKLKDIPLAKMLKVEDMVNTGHLTREHYEELVGLWHALSTGATTPDEYFDNMEKTPF